MMIFADFLIFFSPPGREERREERGRGAGDRGAAGTCAARRGAARGAALLPLLKSSPRRRE